MKKESLQKAREVIIQAISKSDINLIDKLELAMNLTRLLSEENYEKDIKVLRLGGKNEK